MRFWDSSAVVPLCLREPQTDAVTALLSDDPEMAVWWGTLVECWSAFARLRREGVLDLKGEEVARATVGALQESWSEIQPTEEIRQQAGRLMRVHHLRASDAFQLAAALMWAARRSSPRAVALDRQLREAAWREGLAPLPD